MVAARSATVLTGTFTAALPVAIDPPPGLGKQVAIVTNLDETQKWLVTLGHPTRMLKCSDLMKKPFADFRLDLAKHPPEVTIFEVPAIFRVTDRAARLACERLVALAHQSAGSGARTVLHGGEKTPAWTSPALSTLASSQQFRSTIVSECRLDGAEVEAPS